MKRKELTKTFINADFKLKKTPLVFIQNYFSVVRFINARPNVIT